MLALSIEDACDSWKVGQGVVLTVLRQEDIMAVVKTLVELKDGKATFTHKDGTAWEGPR